MEWIEKARGLLERLPQDWGTGAAIAVGVLFFALAWSRIFARAGYHWGMGFAMLVPGVNLFLFLALAFRRWPIEKRLRYVYKSAVSSRRAA